MLEKRIIEAEVLTNEEIAPDIKQIVLLVDDMAAEARPGQFVNVYTKSDRLLLPRPISICDADDDSITLLYAVVGAGTAELGKAVFGDIIRITSPMGKGFQPPHRVEAAESRDFRRIVLVGGGVGVAPLYFAARTLSKTHIPITVVLGFKKDLLLVNEFKELGCRVYVTTEIPTESAFIGNVIDCMEVNEVHGDIYYSCGPRPMLAAVTDYIIKNDKNAEIQVSLEERMGCGYGACVGCVCDVAKVRSDGSTVVEHLKVCHDGPVFDGRKVIWK